MIISSKKTALLLSTGLSLALLANFAPYAIAAGSCDTITDSAQQQSCNSTCSEFSYNANKQTSCQNVYSGCANDLSGRSEFWRNLYGGYEACQGKAKGAAVQEGCSVQADDYGGGTYTGTCFNKTDTATTVTIVGPAGVTTYDGSTNRSGTSGPGKPSCTGGACDLEYQPLEPLPSGFSGQASSDTYANFGQYLNYLFPILIAAGALFSVLMMTVSGIEYMVSVSGETKSQSLNRIRACLWGLLLLIGSVLILQTVNPALVVFNLQSIGQLKQEAVSTPAIKGSSSGSVQVTPAQPAQAIPTAPATGGASSGNAVAPKTTI